MLVDQLVHERAARVVVVLVFAVEAFFIEEQLVDRVDDALDVARSFQTRAHGVAPRSYPREIRVDVEVRLFLERNHQRALDEVETRIGQTGDGAKPLTRKSRM